MSIDVAVLQADKRKTGSMEQVITSAAKGCGGRMLGLIKGDNPSELPLELARLMLKRVRSFQIRAEPDIEKRKRLKQLHKKIER
jgi:hypothetical protein